MQCLGIPVDHRLRGIIRHSQEYPDLGDESRHLEILRELGSRVERGVKPIMIGELNHGLELAGPAIQGGVLPVLLRPPRNQTYDHGFTADVEANRTTDAIRQLILVATNSKWCLDEVSVFDKNPFAPEDCNDEALLKHSEEAFCRAVKAKKPDVVICCYQGEVQSESLAKELRSLGVGKVFPDPQPNTSWKLTRVNAFHPSYAVNYNPTYSCFRRLLLLEFVHAFSIWQGCWREEPWMNELRSECERKASQLAKEQIKEKGRNSVKDKLRRFQRRWEAVLRELSARFMEVDFFRGGYSDAREQLIKSSISWLCCDAALCLEEYEAQFTRDGTPVERLLSEFHAWCLKSWPSLQPEVINHSRGYFNHDQFLQDNSQPDPFLRKLRQLLVKFLSDLNLSFVHTKQHQVIEYDIKAQKHAFQRFSQGLENVAEKSVSSLQASMAALTIQQDTETGA